MKDVDELQKELLANVKKIIEETPALSHVSVSIRYNDDFYIEECLKEDGIFEEYKEKWGDEFCEITDFYENYVIKVISQVLGRPIVSCHYDNKFVLEFPSVSDENEEKKLWDVITSLGCNIEYIESGDVLYRFIVRELQDNMIDDKYFLFSTYIDGIEFVLPLTNQYIYESI